MPGGYIALAWPPNAASAGADTLRLMRLRPELEAGDAWRLVHNRPGLWVFVKSDRPLTVRRLQGRSGVVIGDLFELPSGRSFSDPVPIAPEAQSAPDAALCRQLVQTAWGRYVAILPSPSGETVGVFRDPLGGLDGIVWRRDGVTVAASDLPDALLRLLGPRLAMDWARVAALVADTANLAGEPALHGLAAVFPGTLRRLGDGVEAVETLWSPAAFARPDRGRGVPGPADLVETLDACVGAWAAAYRPVLAELSGGLDSAVVGAALAQTPDAQVCGWVNYHVRDPVGDERAHARAVAWRLDLPLTEAAKPELTIDLARLGETADGPRPTLNGSDVLYDADMAERARALGAAAVITGQGGDALFFQMPTALVVADHLHRLGPAGLGSPFPMAVAAWLRVSIWSVWREALLGWAGLRNPRRRRPPPFVSTATRRAAARAPRHPWLQGLAGVPPAKRLHIEAIAYGLLFFGDCRRGRAASLIHPLLSQPLVELCLAIPADRLTEGGRDRALARRAFASRLPAGVVGRWSKGDLTAYYGRAIAGGLEALRPFLIEGRLATQGIVDPVRLDRLLTVDGLMQDGRYADIMDLAAIEAWVRAWEARIDRLGRLA